MAAPTGANSVPNKRSRIDIPAALPLGPRSISVTSRKSRTSFAETVPQATCPRVGGPCYMLLRAERKVGRHWRR